MDFLAEARRRLDAGDPKSAHLLAQRALDDLRTEGSRETTALAAHLVGESLYVLGDIAGARSLAEEALRAHEELGNYAAIGADLNLVGVLDLTEGRTNDAVIGLRRSLDLRTEKLGPDDAATIESLNNLAVALWRGGDEVEALRLHEEALERCERSLGEDHRRTAETLNALAVKLPTRPGQERRTRQLSERALASAEAALGLDSELVARLLANLATTRMNDGELEAARPLLERSLELHERHFGPMSRWTAYVLSFAAEHAWAEGRFEDARGFFERAFVIRMAESGPSDPETLDAALGLMNVLGELGGGARLVPESPEVSPTADTMELMTAFYLPLVALHPDLQGAFSAGSPDPVTAEEQLRHLADRLSSRVAPDAKQLAALEDARELTDAADAAYLSGDLASAVRLLNDVVALLEDVYGPSDTSLVEPMRRLRLVHRMGGTESAVLPILRRIASILGDAYGEIHPITIRALSEVFWQERRDYGPAGGRETAAQIQELTRKVLGDESALARLLQDVFAAAQESVPPGAELWDPPLSALRERFLAEPSPLVATLLGDLEETPWPTLYHAYGPALDTPIHLRLLLAGDERLRADALQLLAESLLGSGESSSALAPAISHLARLAADERVPDVSGVAELLRGAEALERGDLGE